MLVELQVSIQGRLVREAEKIFATLPKRPRPRTGPRGFLYVAPAGVKTQACTYLASTISILQNNINAYRRIFPKPSDTHRLIAPFAQQLSQVSLASTL